MVQEVDSDHYESMQLETSQAKPSSSCIVHNIMIAKLFTHLSAVIQAYQHQCPPGGRRGGGEYLYLS